LLLGYVFYLGAFALGLLLGRKVGAREVEVPPKLVFLPVSSLEGADPSGVFIKTLVEAGAPNRSPRPYTPSFPATPR
jgi:hypothetical protein